MPHHEQSLNENYVNHTLWQWFPKWGAQSHELKNKECLDTANIMERFLMGLTHNAKQMMKHR